MCVCRWTHFWSRCTFISSVAKRPGPARLALESNNTINETLLKHASKKNSCIKHSQLEKKPGKGLWHQPVWVNSTKFRLTSGPLFNTSSLIVFCSYSKLELPWGFGRGSLLELTVLRNCLSRKLIIMFFPLTLLVDSVGSHQRSEVQHTWNLNNESWRTSLHHCVKVRS